MKQYRLRSSTIAVMAVEGRSTIATVPEGSVVIVEGDLDQSAGNEEIEVQVGGRRGLMFAIDVRERGEELA